MFLGVFDHQCKFYADLVLLWVLRNKHRYLEAHSKQSLLGTRKEIETNANQIAMFCLTRAQYKYHLFLPMIDDVVQIPDKLLA